MSAYATKDFARFARRAGLSEAKLTQAAQEMAEGRWDADLGGGVFKQRIAREGGGKSGGFRVIVLFRSGHHVFFAHGFAKSAKANISAKELTALKLLANVLLAFTSKEIVAAKAAGELIEVATDAGQEA